MSFVYVWKYRVRPEALAAFEAAYGPDGDWVRLFRRHEGYLGTELLRELADPNVYRTIDRWRSREDRDRFRAAATAEFEAIDHACAALTLEEQHLGDFETVGSEEGA